MCCHYILNPPRIEPCIFIFFFQSGLTNIFCGKDKLKEVCNNNNNNNNNDNNNNNNVFISRGLHI